MKYLKYFGESIKKDRYSSGTCFTVWEYINNKNALIKYRKPEYNSGMTLDKYYSYVNTFIDKLGKIDWFKGNVAYDKPKNDPNRKLMLIDF